MSEPCLRGIHTWTKPLRSPVKNGEPCDCGLTTWQPAEFQAEPPACPSCTALRQQLAQAQQERDEAKSHSAKCATCGKWSCGFCGVSDGKGNWTCELCWGVGPLAEATKRAEAAESRLREVTQERDALKEQNESAASRLEAELNTPDDIWADHIREALRLLTEAEATRDTPTEPTT